MNADALLKLIDSHRDDEIVTATRDLGEAERQQLHDAIAQRFSSDLQRESKETIWPESTSIRLAALAVCGKKEAKRICWQDLSRAIIENKQTESFVDQAVEIILARQPTWAGEWLDKQWHSCSYELPAVYVTLMRLVREGLCQRPTSSAYARVFAQQRVLDFDGDRDILEKDIWLLFQYELNCWDLGPFSKKLKERDTWRSKWTRWPGGSKPHRNGRRLSCWPRAIYWALSESRVDRSRLLDCVLKALGGKLQGKSIQGLLVLHDLLAPTATEIDERREIYIELIEKGTPAVVKDFERLSSTDLTSTLQQTSTAMRPGTRVQVEQYNDGPNFWLYDDVFTEQLRAAEMPQGGRSWTDSTPNAAEASAAKTGQALCVLTDGDFDGCEVMLGTPSTAKLRSTGHRRSGSGMLSLPGGQLRLDGPNWLRFHEENLDIPDTESESAVIECEPGQYEVTIYRADLEDDDDDEIEETLVSLKRIGDVSTPISQPTSAYFLGF